MAEITPAPKSKKKLVITCAILGCLGLLLVGGLAIGIGVYFYMNANIESAANSNTKNSNSTNAKATTETNVNTTNQEDIYAQLEEQGIDINANTNDYVEDALNDADMQALLEQYDRP